VTLTINGNLNLTMTAFMTYSGSTDGSFSLPQQSGTAFWAGQLDANIPAFLQSQGYPASTPVTQIYLSLDEDLSTWTTFGASALIDKKLFGIAVETDPVPEPGTITLLLAGAVGLLLYGWRRRAAQKFCP
jgi:hypothetical protein